MKMHYDPETDALLIELLEAAPVSSIDYEEGVTAALDRDGRVVALEILDFKERMEHGGALSPLPPDAVSNAADA